MKFIEGPKKPNLNFCACYSSLFPIYAPIIKEQ